MLFTNSFLVLLIFSGALSTSVAVDTQESIITVGGHQIHVATVPLNSTSSFITTGTTISPTALTKRTTTENGCQFGCTETCVNGLSTSPDPPLAADCTALSTALNALAQTEITTTFPCNVPNQFTCPNFVVAPGFERQYTLGTCLVGFANLYPAGGPNVSGCDYLVAGVMPGLFTMCMVNAETTGGICAQTLDLLFAYELRHI